MKRLLFALLLVGMLPLVARAQSPSSTYGNITVNATNCAATPAACVTLAFTSPSTGSVGIQVGGTYTGTLEFEASIDNGTTWTAISGTPLASTTTATSTTGTGTWRFSVGGLTNIRVRASAAVTGTALVVIKSASVAAGLSGGGGSPGGLDTQVQFNDGGAFGGDANLTWSKTDRLLTVLSDPVSFGGFYVEAAGDPTNATTINPSTIGIGALWTDVGSGHYTLFSNYFWDATSADAPNAGDGIGLRGGVIVPAGKTVTDIRGLVIKRGAKSGIGAWTNNTGIYCEDLHGLATNNYCIHIADQGTGANDYAIKVEGGNSNLGPDTVTIGKLAKLTNYNATTLTGDGIPYIVANDDQTAQGAALSAVSLIASVPAAGMYEVTWVASVTTAGDVSSVLGGATGFQVIYTSPTDSVAKTSNPTTITAGTSAGNTTATTVGGTVVAYCKVGTALQYSFGYTSVNAGVMKYEIHVKAKALGN